MISKSNLHLGNHLDYFGTKFRSMDAQVLFRSFRTKIIQSTTATTSIAIRCANLKAKFFVIARRPVAEAIHTKRMDCHDFASQNLAMTERNQQPNFNTKEHK